MFARMIKLNAILMLRRVRSTRLEAWERAPCMWPMLRDAPLRVAPQHEVLVKLPESAVHAPAREASRGMAFDAGGPAFWGDPREEVFSSPKTHEFHEAHEESAPMPMASGSEAIPHES